MEKKFTSLDRYFSCKAKYIEPDRYRNLLTLDYTKKYIAQGSGISYVPASFGRSSQVINLRSFDRILYFNKDEKIIVVEGGITIGKLYNFLTQHKLCLPVQPGHPQITIGGCIACNIFGKNQVRHGLFSASVIEIQLYHPLHGVLSLSGDENSEIFELTCGGFGLTGIIISAKLRLSHIEGDVITHNIKVDNLLDTFNALNDLRDKSDLLYTWNDLSTFGRKFGRGFIVSGNFSRSNPALRESHSFKELAPHNTKLFNPRIFNRVTTSLLNNVYFIQNTRLRPNREISFFEFSYPVADKILYFNMYGKKGFIEQQILVQRDACEEYLREFESLVKQHRPLVVLCSCKAFSGKRKLLNFNGDGIVLSIDVPNLQGYKDFFVQLDLLNIKYGAVGNICKDSRIAKEVVKEEYKEGYDEFKERLHGFDPKRLFVSELSERLGL